MKVGALLNTLIPSLRKSEMKVMRICQAGGVSVGQGFIPPPVIDIPMVPSAGTKLIRIAAGTYRAGGVNTPVQQVSVGQGFFAPPGEVTNAQAQVVVDKYLDRPDGLFLRDTMTGQYYLYAIGQGYDYRDFDTIDPKLLPPQLGIGDSFEGVRQNRAAQKRLYFGSEVLRILPLANRYEDCENQASLADPEVAITCITGWQAQALAQLFGDREIADYLFGVGGMGGTYFADLLTNDQWGLMAMEGALKFMTSTGKRAGSGGENLSAHDRLPLPNGVLPNTVWNWVKDIDHEETWQGPYQKLRGSSLCIHLDPETGLLWFFRSFDDLPIIGMRVGYFPRMP